MLYCTGGVLSAEGKSYINIVAYYIFSGTSNESYITHLVHQAAQHGYRYDF